MKTIKNFQSRLNKVANQDEKKKYIVYIYYNEEDYESHADYCVYEDTLQINGWSMDDTIYGITSD